MRPIIRLGLSLALACLLLLMAVPGDSRAIPYKIEGYFRDTLGNPITLANITISGERFDPITNEFIPSTYHRETDANGYYVIHVAGNEPGGFPLGSVLTISNGTGVDMVSTTVMVDESHGAWANLTYEEPTGLGDAFNTPVVVVLLVIIVATILFTAYYLFKSEDGKPEDSPKRVERRRRGK